MSKSEKDFPTSSRPHSQRRRMKALSPLSTVVIDWVIGHTLLPPQEECKCLEDYPKRWVVYPPLVLLPSGSFGTAEWRKYLALASAARLEGEEQGDGRRTTGTIASKLWEEILRAVEKTQNMSRGTLTRLAVNEPIPPVVALGPYEGRENITRTPTGMRILYGDFGPELSLLQAQQPGRNDFEEAFWASTRENNLYQTWAPRYVMFSRGNITEKARLLNFHHPSHFLAIGKKQKHTLNSLQFPQRVIARGALRDSGAWAIDLYAGIGYFVFSYVRMGLRVLCWEVNPWSVEGLRRGAERNGFSIRVVRGEELKKETNTLVFEGGEQIVVFEEDNTNAARRIRETRMAGGMKAKEHRIEVLHVNLGLLPRSDDRWQDAVEILGQGMRKNNQEKGKGKLRGIGKGWLHLHENVGAKDIEARRAQVESLMRGWCAQQNREAIVEYVEKVKTYAPGVWHCVFDVFISEKTE